MSQLRNAFKTTAGTVFKKVEDKRGTIRYFKDGTPVKRESWAGANRSLEHIVTDDKGDLPADIREAETVADLKEATGIPFDVTRLQAIEAGDTKPDRVRAEANRFIGFWTRQPDLGPEDRKEAADRYINFRNDMRGVEDPEARQIIRDRYNVPGS